MTLALSASSSAVWGGGAAEAAEAAEAADILAVIQELS